MDVSIWNSTNRASGWPSIPSEADTYRLQRLHDLHLQHDPPALQVKLTPEIIHKVDQYPVPKTVVIFRDIAPADDWLRRHRVSLWTDVFVPWLNSIWSTLTPIQQRSAWLCHVALHITPYLKLRERAIYLTKLHEWEELRRYLPRPLPLQFGEEGDSMLWPLLPEKYVPINPEAPTANETHGFEEWLRGRD